MDRIIQVKVNGNYVTKDCRNAGVQGEYNMTSLRIEFDEGWDGFAKHITWWDAYGKNPVEVILTTDLLEDITKSTRIYVCLIPGEPLAVDGDCSFVIDGYIEGKKQRSVQDYLYVKPADSAENAGKPVDPTPTQAEQLQREIENILPSMQEQAQIATNAATEAKNSADSVGNSLAKAEESARSAAESAKEAKESAETIGDSVSRAETARDAAETSASEAKTNASNAETSAQNASQSATQSASSASASVSSASAAKQSEANAGNSATSAAASAQSANAAKEGLETAERNAAASASAAATSASNAKSSESAAKAAQSAAEKARDDAQGIVGGDFATKDDAQGYANTAEGNANKYTDEQIAAIPTPDLSGYSTATNLLNGSAEGSLRSVGAKEELGDYAFAEGLGSSANGIASHAEGNITIANGNMSHAEGIGTTANGAQQHVQGAYNIPDTASAHIVGNGAHKYAISNAHTLDWSGNAWFAGDVYVGSTSGTNKDEGSKKLATEAVVDEKIAAIPAPDVSGQISAHNSSSTAHSDIRTAVSNAASAASAAQTAAANASASAETKALYGLDEGATNNDVLAKLSNAAFIQRKYQKVTDASQLPVGSVIKLNVDSTPTEFIVVHQGNPDPALYDASCDGTWLLTKDAYYGPTRWTDGTRETYSESQVNEQLIGWFYPLFDDAAKSVIQEVKVPYCTDSPGTVVATGADGVAAKAFLLSASEVFQSHSHAVDGACLSYFADVTTSDTSKRRAYKDGDTVTWWLRSVDSSNYPYALTVLTNGALSKTDKTNTSTAYWRPAVIIKGDISGLGIYTNGEELTNDEALGNSIGLFDALGVPANLGGVKIETGSYTGTGTYGSSNRCSLTFGFAPKMVMIYTPKMTMLGAGSTSSSSNPIYFGIGLQWFFANGTGFSVSYPAYGNNKDTTYTFSENTLEWYNAGNAVYQMNNSEEYRYLAIG